MLLQFFELYYCFVCVCVCDTAYIYDKNDKNIIYY